MAVSDYEKKKAEFEERKREEEENDRWMEFFKKREILKTNFRKRTLPDWIESVQTPAKRMRLEEVMCSLTSPKENTKPEPERYIITITNTVQKEPAENIPVQQKPRLALSMREKSAMNMTRKEKYDNADEVYTTTPQKQGEQNAANSTPNQRKLFRINV